MIRRAFVRAMSCGILTALLGVKAWRLEDGEWEAGTSDAREALQTVGIALDDSVNGQVAMIQIGTGHVLLVHAAEPLVRGDYIGIDADGRAVHTTISVPTALLGWV